MVLEIGNYQKEFDLEMAYEIPVGVFSVEC